MRAAAGPCLIVTAVLVTLHDIAFLGMLPDQNKDIPAFFLPNHCFLGRSLAAGHIPAWSPHVMGGAPFAADPQSGWMALLPMGLYSTLGCDVAMRWLLVLHPVLAGLGMYWFLRVERVSRSAATVGGLVLAMVMAASKVAANVPFGGLLAWTPVLMAATACYLRAPSGSRRALWAGAAALAWGQLAASHLSHGLLVGTGALAAVLVGVGAEEVRAGRLRMRRAVVLGAVLIVALPVVNLAFLMPRLAYLPDTNLAMGYDGMRTVTARFAGVEVKAPEAILPTEPPWLLRLATSPGAYAGALALALSPAALLSRRRRLLAVSLAVYGAIFYLAGLRAVVVKVAPLLEAVPLADFYPHRPERFRYAVLLAVAALAGLGVDAWIEERSARRRLAMASGVVLWGLGALAAGARPSVMALFLAGAIAGAVALLATARRGALAPILAVVLAVELSAGALAGQAASPSALSGVEKPGPNPLAPLSEPDLDAASLVSQERAARLVLAGPPGRVIELDPRLQKTSRAMISGTESAQGFNPAQPRRYWTFVQAVNEQWRGEFGYNKARFVQPLDDVTLDLLQVRWALARSPSAIPAVSVAHEGERAVLLERHDVSPRAALSASWKVVASPGEALEAVTARNFEASEMVVLEHGPGLEPAESSGPAVPARYMARGPQDVRVEVNAPAPGVLLIRNSYDDGWNARVDGRSAPVLRADYFVQAVAVPAGEHVVTLSYEDPWIGLGALGSALALGGLVLLAAGLRRREMPSQGPSSQDSGNPHAA